MKSGRKSRRKPAEPIQPPADLSERSRAIWRDIVPRRIVTPERLALFTEALRALDRADEAREILKSAGPVIESKRSGLPHAHPAAAIEHKARAQFLRAWRTLDLGKGGAWSLGYPLS